ncbi:replication endonuclease, partial [Vibrio rotiferianus]|uniref:replication endonuclease n=1 Tax=Vibrio rotiferianus TaxID=190895 RepID=UPI002351EACA
SGGEVNQKWLDAGRPTAKQGHAHIMNVLDNWRKALDKEDIKFYGLRVVEPHQTAHLMHICWFSVKRNTKNALLMLCVLAL